MNDTRFDQLISDLTEKLFPVCDWLLIKAQVAQESSFDQNAKSPVGALGLLQIMPATGKELGLSEQELLVPFRNLDAGLRYLRLQYICFPEIAEHEEKLKFALASYNAGRGYINKALALAYEFEKKASMPSARKDVQPGNWQKWEYSKEKLKSPQCVVNGKKPDWKQATDYVEKIWKRYLSYKGAA